LASRILENALALALDDKVLALAVGTSGLGLGLERKVLAFAKTQATWLLYVYALLIFLVSHDSLPFLV